MGDCPERTQRDFETAAQARLGPLAATLDMAAFQAVWLLHQAADAARRHVSDRVLTGAGLSWTQFEVLWHLWIFGTEEPRCVSSAVGVSKASVTVATAALEKRGLIHRRIRTNDRRRVDLAVTDAGGTLMAELFPRFNGAESDFSATLDEQERIVLADLLRRLLADRTLSLVTVTAGAGKPA